MSELLEVENFWVVRHKYVRMGLGKCSCVLAHECTESLQKIWDFGSWELLSIFCEVENFWVLFGFWVWKLRTSWELAQVKWVTLSFFSGFGSWVRVQLAKCLCVVHCTNYWGAPGSWELWFSTSLKLRTVVNLFSTSGNVITEPPWRVLTWFFLRWWLAL